MGAGDLRKVAYTKVHLRLLKQIYIGGCPRTYEGCPSGWDHSEGTCVPPPHYDGLCSSFNESLIRTRPLEAREATAWKCRMSWPCSGHCSRDFHGCPVSWTDMGRGLCIAPETYRGICSPATDFAELSASQKAVWAERCDATWPCMQSEQILQKQTRTENGPIV